MQGRNLYFLYATYRLERGKTLTFLITFKIFYIMFLGLFKIAYFIKLF